MSGSIVFNLDFYKPYLEAKEVRWILDKLDERYIKLLQSNENILTRMLSSPILNHPVEMFHFQTKSRSIVEDRKVYLENTKPVRVQIDTPITQHETLLDAELFVTLYNEPEDVLLQDALIHRWLKTEVEQKLQNLKSLKIRPDDTEIKKSFI